MNKIRDIIKVGKYTIIIGVENNKMEFKALRHEEPWIDDLTNVDGSNMIMDMAYEIQKLRIELGKYGYEFK